MIPVNQTRTGKTGNCFAAAVASIFEIPLRVVPEFDDDGFIPTLAAWLMPLDLMYIQVLPSDPILRGMFRFGEAWHTIEGISERGGLHACVGRNGKLIHDPHPGGHGLVQIETFGLFIKRFNQPFTDIDNGRFR